ncbi:MAG: PAS domain-containing protein [Rhodoblastus sp.]|nr:PAS domain-containing protein [Rhodoblastus sp.]
MGNATLRADAKGFIVAWSDAAERLLGHTASEAIGQSLEIIIPPHLRAAHASGFARFVRTGESRLPETVPTSALRRDGQIARLNISVRAIRNPAGEIVAVDAWMRA